MRASLDALDRQRINNLLVRTKHNRLLAKVYMRLRSETGPLKENALEVNTNLCHIELLISIFKLKRDHP